MLVVASRGKRFIPARAGNASLSSSPLWCCPVHPRACGERTPASAATAQSAGSSPRVRGTRERSSISPIQARFIPARAGNAATFCLRRSRSAVHPRACGERTITTSAISSAAGSSPRVRGTPRNRSPMEPGRRFIPARAGNAAKPMSPALRAPVHPRACGERRRRDSLRRSAAGSSPRVRGTHIFLQLDVQGCQVHPRACGERRGRTRDEHVDAGSSPRVRGTQARIPGGPGLARFIPARAGNAAATSRSAISSPVHPRACGERNDLDAGHRGERGSSPRVRGTLLDVEGQAKLLRFIPARAGNAAYVDGELDPVKVHPRACGERSGSGPAGAPFFRFIPARAGNAGTMLPSWSSRPVHPRACGERRRSTIPARRSFGSSPRVRGTPTGRTCRPRRLRFIPARAGNAWPA